jgi:putative transcriptional regulator
MPGMGDPRFEKAVVFLCAHSGDGAMGLIVNKPMPDLVFGNLLKELKIPGGENPKAHIRVHFGGPVEHGRGFVLHSGDYARDKSTLRVNTGFGMTATRDILEDIAHGDGPERAFLALGYAGWSPGQLESEIGRNGWLTAEANPELVFAPENSSKWTGALKTLGVDALVLSSAAGRA